MGKPSGGNETVTQTSQPPQQFLNAYQGAVSNAQNLAAQPYQQYTGSLLAPINPNQQAGIDQIANSANYAQAYLPLAQNEFSSSATPITATPFSTSAVNQYLSPYTQDVTSSLQSLFNQQNATQLSQVQGNAAAQGAFGGDREAVAAAQTAGQQQAQEAPVLAQTLQTGYNTALGEFNAQQQAQLQAAQATGWLQQGAGYGLANLGNEAENEGLAGGQALIGAGGLQQQQAQEALNIPYEQFIAQESYPYQMAGWEANIAEGLGGASGGTSSTQYPGPSALSQVAGLGLTGTGLLGATGAFGSSGYLTGNSGLLSGLFGGAADAGSFDPSLLAGLGGAADADFSGGLLGAGLAAVKSGGRINRQAGGALTTPYGTGIAVPGMANPQGGAPATGVPQLPNLSNGYIPTPPPSVGSRTMPTGAGAGMQQQQQQPVMQALQTLQALKGIKGLFPGDSPSTPAAAMGGAVNLATPYQGFQDGGSPIESAGQAMTGGQSPLTQGLLRQYLQMPLEQLQELAQRAPPSTPQGQVIQKALQLKHMNPGTGIGGAGAPQPPQSPQGLAATPAPVGPATSGLSPVLAGSWAGGRIGRQEGGDIPGLSIAAGSPFAQSSPDVDLPAGVSIATTPTANVISQQGTASPQMVSGAAGLAVPANQNGLELRQPSLASLPQVGNATANQPTEGDMRHDRPVNTTLADVPHERMSSSLPDAKSLGVNPLVYNYLVNHVAPGESRGNPNALYGSGSFTDDSAHPADLGWKGGVGPDGRPTHAAGLLQDEPDTWHRIQLATGVPDFSPGSQIKGNAWLAEQTYHDRTGRDLATDLAAGKTAQVDQALSGQWPSLAHSGKDGQNLATGPLGTGAGSGPALTAPFTQESAQGQGAGGLSLSDPSTLLAAKRTPSGDFYSSPWMPLIATGAGMLASRSPFPGVALGEGLETGLKELGSQQATVPENELRQAQAQTAQIQNALLPQQMQALSNVMGSATEAAAPPMQTGLAVAPSTQSSIVPNSSGQAGITNPSGGTVMPASGLAVPPNMGSDPSFAQLDQKYAQIDRQIALAQKMLPLYPQRAPELGNTIASQMANYARLVESDPRMQAAKAGMVAEAEKNPKIETAAGEASAQVGPHVAQATGEAAGRAQNELANYSVPLPGGSGTMELQAPKSQVLAGTAPGMKEPITATAQHPAEPVTQGGRYDPDPNSIIPTAPPPGVTATKINLSKAAEEKLTDDAGRLKLYAQQAQDTPLQLVRVNELNDLLGKYSTGQEAAAGYKLMAWAKGAGLGGLIPEGYDPSNAEQINKLATQLVFSQIRQIGGRVLVSEIEGLSRANPNIALTPQANAAILQNVALEQNLAKDRYVNASKVFSAYGQLGNFDQKYIANSPAGEMEENIRKELVGGTTPAEQRHEPPPAAPLPQGYPAGARQSPLDGQWYVPNPAGGYFRVTPNAANP